MMETVALTVDASTLAGLLSVSVRTVRTWDRLGTIPAPVRIGGRVLWRTDEIRQWLDAGSPDRETWDARRSVKRR